MEISQEFTELTDNLQSEEHDTNCLSRTGMRPIRFVNRLFLERNFAGKNIKVDNYEIKDR